MGRQTHRTGEPSMATTKSKVNEYVHYHKDGSLWAKGQMLDGVQVGYWE
jgi:hypothetical protein